MEQLLGNDFGGMDEVYADAYRMTDDPKYLDAAKRFSHRWLLDSMGAKDAPLAYEDAVKRAYAQRLKTTHPEDDPEGFQRLHSAYQEASRMARRRARSFAFSGSRPKIDRWT